MDRATVIDRAVNFRQRFRNALAVDHNTMIHCPLMRHTTIKKKATELKGTPKYSTKITLQFVSL